MTFNRLPFEEMKPVDNGVIVRIALDHIAVASCEMSRDEAEIGVMIIKSYCHRALVTRDST